MKRITGAVGAADAIIAARAAQEAKKRLDDVEAISQEFGILPNFISTTVGVLPISTGAVANVSKGLYFTDAGTAQIVEWNGTEWVDKGKAILTASLNNAEAIKFNITDTISGVNNPYVAWPYACTFYDSSRKKFVQVYTIGGDHTGPTKFVEVRSMSDEGIERKWGSPTLIADERASSLGATAHAANIMPDGSYLVGIRLSPDVSTNTVTYLLCRSTDGGATWVNEQWKTTTDADILPAEAGGFFLTRNGSVLSYYRGKDGSQAILKSTNANGLNGTWSFKPLTKPMNGTPLEGSFVQLATGRIVCVARRNIGSGTLTNPNTPLYTYSDDDGETWTPLAFTNVLDCFDNPVAFLHLKSKRQIICMYCSRRDSGNDLGSIYYSLTTEEAIQEGDLGNPIKIGNGIPNSDFGYASLAESTKGEVLFSYYNGDRPKTSIFTYLGYIKGQNGAELMPNPVKLNEYKVEFMPNYSAVTGVFGAITYGDLAIGVVRQFAGFVTINIRIETNNLSIGTASGIIQIDIAKYLRGILPQRDVALDATLVRGFNSSKAVAVMQPYLQSNGIIRMTTNVDITKTTTEFLEVSDIRTGATSGANRMLISGTYSY